MALVRGKVPIEQQLLGGIATPDALWKRLCLGHGAVEQFFFLSRCSFPYAATWKDSGPQGSLLPSGLPLKMRKKFCASALDKSTPNQEGEKVGNSHQRPRRNKTQKEKHAPHHAQKVDLKLGRDIIHTGDGGSMAGATVGIRLSDGACSILSRPSKVFVISRENLFP